MCQEDYLSHQGVKLRMSKLRIIRIPDASSPEDLGRSNSGIRSFVYDFIHCISDTCTWRRSWLFRVPLAEMGLLVASRSWQAFRSDASTGCGYMSELTPCLKDSKDSISRYIRWSCLLLSIRHQSGLIFIFQIILMTYDSLS